MKATYIDHMGSDLSVVNAARVSFGKQSDWDYVCVDGHSLCSEIGRSSSCPYCEVTLSEKDKKLINYLAVHKHLSPFNHTFITMHMKAPIFVARQLQKHEYMPWNEISRRYVDDDPELYWPETIREKAKDKKQGSGGPHPTINHGVGTGYYEGIKETTDLFLNEYYFMIRDGVAPEQARMILPQNTYTEWYWSGTLGAWAKMYNLRSKPDAQQETRELILQCGKILEKLYPVSWKALING